MMRRGSRTGASITLRLTAFFALVSSLVLLVLGYLIGDAVERHFIEQDLEILDGKRHLVERAVAEVASPDDLSDLARRLDDARAGFSGLVLVVAFGSDRLVFAGQGGDYPKLLLDEAPSEPTRLRRWRDADDRPWRGVAVRVPYQGKTDEVRAALALDISHHEHFMQSFRRTLWTVVGLAAVLIGVLGHFAVRRGLRPLQTIRQRAEEVTARRLDARLLPEAFPAELTELVAALNAMLARLEEAFVRLSDFSSDLAHEFRTPVSNLMMQAQVTLARARSAEEYREVLGSSIEEYERLSGMIADMLFIAQAEEGRLMPNRETLDLAALADELADYYRLAADERGIRLRVVGEAHVEGDRAMLRRALSNLLANAVRHTPVGGEVLLDLLSTEGLVEVGVQNSGSQIPSEHLPHLFDRFYRVDPARQRDEGRTTGLGLAIVKSIVEAHGGQAAVSSDAQATRFVLRFPVVASRLGSPGPTLHG